MSPDALDLVVRQGFGLVVLILLPLVAAAAASATAAGVLASRLGVQDGTVTLVARALAVVLAIGLTVQSVATETLAFTVSLWDQVGDVGRPEQR